MITDTGTVNLKKDVLLVEDSPAISLLLKEFLKKLDYKKIHSAGTGKEGIEVFQNLTGGGIVPIVLLDYTLPDTNANEVITQLFDIRPDVKVVIETAEDKEEQVIKEAIRRGVYLYLQKPIRFDNLKSIMKIIEDEDAVLKDEAESNKSVALHLLPKTIVSIAKLAEQSGLNEAELAAYLKILESQDRVVAISDLKEISCSQCNSVMVEQDFHCPSCSSHDFSQAKLIEHFKCGNVSPDTAYENNTCPKCKKELRMIGIDHKAFDNFYVCKNCQNKFPEPSVKYICAKCNNRFGIEQARWITSNAYKVIS